MLSNALIQLVEDSEGFSEVPYHGADDAPGIFTIGFGFTHYPDGTPVTMQDEPIGKGFAIGILQQLLQQTINGVNALCPSCNQNQKDALTDFAYECGVTALRTSTLLKIILANPSDPAITAEFRSWIHSAGKIQEGMVARRERDVKLYFSPVQSV